VYYLIYSSRSKKDLSKEELFSILEKSRLRNKMMNITGFLLCINEDYHPELINGLFLQVLEGEKQDVMKLYESIEKDGRHKDVKLLAEGRLMKRMFNNWSMGYRDMDILKFKSRLDQYDLSEEDLVNAPGDQQDNVDAVLDFIKSFYKIPNPPSILNQL
jgi:hypothetical protein